MFASFFNLQTQKLKMLIFASCCALAAPAKTHCGNPKGIRPFGAFLPPLLAAQQEVASKLHSAARQLYARGEEKP